MSVNSIIETIRQNLEQMQTIFHADIYKNNSFTGVRLEYHTGNILKIRTDGGELPSEFIIDFNKRIATVNHKQINLHEEPLLELYTLLDPRILLNNVKNASQITENTITATFDINELPISEQLKNHFREYNQQHRTIELTTTNQNLLAQATQQDIPPQNNTIQLKFTYISPRPLYHRNPQHR